MAVMNSQKHFIQKALDNFFKIDPDFILYIYTRQNSRVFAWNVTLGLCISSGGVWTATQKQLYLSSEQL